MTKLGRGHLAILGLILLLPIATLTTSASAASFRMIPAYQCRLTGESLAPTRLLVEAHTPPAVTGIHLVTGLTNQNAWIVCPYTDNTPFTGEKVTSVKIDLYNSGYDPDGNYSAGELSAEVCAWSNWLDSCSVASSSPEVVLHQAASMTLSDITKWTSDSYGGYMYVMMEAYGHSLGGDGNNMEIAGIHITTSY